MGWATSKPVRNEPIRTHFGEGSNPHFCVKNSGFAPGRHENALRRLRNEPIARPSTRVLLLVLSLIFTGCGYNQGDSAAKESAAKKEGYRWSSVYRQDIRTVAVPIFSNKDFARGVEFSLSKALVQQIEANTPYKVVPRERADTILEGEIISVNVNTLSEDRFSAIPQEQLLDVVVNFTWKDLRTGRILVARRGWEQTATYYPTLGEGRFVGTQQAAERVALAIVQELQSDW